MFLALKRLLVLGRDFLIYAARFSLSPNNFNDNLASVRFVGDGGNTNNNIVNNSNGVRPRFLLRLVILLMYRG